MNRYEQVLQMSVAEMAKFLSDIQWDSSEPTEQEMYDWLIDEGDVWDI